MRWIVFLSIFLLLPSIYAHGVIESIDPEPNSILPGSLDNISIIFSESIVISATKIRVLAENGTTVPVTFYSTEDPKELLLVINTQTNETLTISWQVLSAIDGHVTEGAFLLFSSEPGSYTNIAVDWKDSLFFFLELLGIALLFGIYFTKKTSAKDKFTAIASVLIIAGAGFRLLTLLTFSTAISLALILVVIRILLAIIALFVKNKHMFLLAILMTASIAGASHAVANLSFPILAFLLMAVHLIAKLILIGVPIAACVAFFQKTKPKKWQKNWSIALACTIATGSIVLTLLLGQAQNFFLYSWGKISFFILLMVLLLSAYSLLQRYTKKQYTAAIAIFSIALLIASSIIAFTTPPPAFGNVKQTTAPLRLASVSLSEPWHAPDAYLVSANFPQGTGQIDIWLENPDYNITKLFPEAKAVGKSSFAFTKRAMALPGSWQIHTRVATPNQPANTLVFGRSGPLPSLRSQGLSFSKLLFLIGALSTSVAMYFLRTSAKESKKKTKLTHALIAAGIVLLVATTLVMFQSDFEKQCVDSGYNWQRSPVIFADEKIGSIPVIGCTVSERGKVYHFPDKESVRYWLAIVEARGNHKH